MITALTLLPLVGGILVVGLGEDHRKLARGLALATSFLSLALVLAMIGCFDTNSGGFQFEELSEWIPVLKVQYHSAVDGLGILMLLLTALVTPMSMLASWRLSDRSHIYFALVLFLEAGLFGTFTALNFFHWFLFWELSLIPAFFLVRLWGGPQRAAASTQFFVYTMVGSVALLMSFLALWIATGSFDFIELAKFARTGGLKVALGDALGWKDLSYSYLAAIIFGGAFLGFAVKTPMMPFHTWLPATYTEAPAGTTMLLTGVMSKMGVYGFVRILLPIFHQEMAGQRMRILLLTLATVTIVFSAFAAFAQRDLRRMLAYSSINHLGYCLLGIVAIPGVTNADVAVPVESRAALSGVFLQMFNHGLTAATLFWFISLLEERSGGLRGLNDFGGLRKVAPVFCGLMGIALFSSLGLPGLNGFVGEFLIFRGTFPLAPWAAGLSVIGILVTAVFILTLLQRVFNGPLNEKWSKLPDLTWRERAMLSIPIALMFVLGIYPQVLLRLFNSTVVEMVKGLNP